MAHRKQSLYIASKIGSLGVRVQVNIIFIDLSKDDTVEVTTFILDQSSMTIPLKKTTLVTVRDNDTRTSNSIHRIMDVLVYKFQAVQCTSADSEIIFRHPICRKEKYNLAIAE